MRGDITPRGSYINVIAYSIRRHNIPDSICLFAPQLDRALAYDARSPGWQCPRVQYCRVCLRVPVRLYRDRLHRRLVPQVGRHKADRSPAPPAVFAPDTSAVDPHHLPQQLPLALGASLGSALVISQGVVVSALCERRLRELLVVQPQQQDRRIWVTPLGLALVQPIISNPMQRRKVPPIVAKQHHVRSWVSERAQAIVVRVTAGEPRGALRPPTPCRDRVGVRVQLRGVQRRSRRLEHRVCRRLKPPRQQSVVQRRLQTGFVAQVHVLLVWPVGVDRSIGAWAFSHCCSPTYLGPACMPKDLREGGEVPHAEEAHYLYHTTSSTLEYLALHSQRSIGASLLCLRAAGDQRIVGPLCRLRI